tara:strand:+ start:33 stop:254 length:222 start_codon:yes stop_codon:yes gene_type:complete
MRLTFAQLRAANLSAQITSVNVYPNGDMFYKYANPTTTDLRAAKPWSSKITDNKAKALFTALAVGTHYIEVTT